MLSKSTYPIPEKESNISGGKMAFIIFILLIQFSIIACAIFMAVKTRVSVVWFDPYLSIDIQGADGYAVTKPVFNEDGFREDFNQTLLSKKSSLSEADAESLVDKVIASLSYDIDVEKAEGRDDADIDSDIDDNAENEELPVPGISNGDTVTVYADLGEDVWREMREQGIYLAFECDPVTLVAEGLPEANPYDPFADLSVSFTGQNGAGEARIYYNGYYPLIFTAEPSAALHNGDVVEVSITFDNNYDLDGIVADYHIMPTSLSQQYTVSGLYDTPGGIEDFPGEARERVMGEAREAAKSLLNEEYQEDEQFTLDDAGMYFASSQETQNYLFCLFCVNYINDAGEEMQYYYYIRFENILLDDSNDVIADFRQIEYPHKPSIPIIGEALGDGAQVSVPGVFTFRTLAGYETLDELISQVITPLETSYTVTSLQEQ